jgi:protein CpxP
MRALNVLLAAIVTASISLSPVISDSSASAQGNYRGGGSRQGRVMDRLNLTPEQKQRMQTIHKETQEQMKPLRQEMRQAQQERKSLLQNNNASTQQLQGNFDKIQGIKNRIAQIQFNRMTKMRDVLTPEQRSQMEKMMQERRGNRGGQRQGKPQGGWQNQGGNMEINGDS